MNDINIIENLPGGISMIEVDKHAYLIPTFILERLSQLQKLQDWVCEKCKIVYPSEKVISVSAKLTLELPKCPKCGSYLYTLITYREKQNINRQQLLNWIIERWDDEVKNRPDVNIHKRTLDGIWRQIYFYVSNGQELPR